MAKSKLTPEVRDKIVQAVKAGNYAKVAAQYAGVDESTLYRWIRQGERQGSGIYYQFCQSLKEAEAESEVRAVAIINRHMNENWTAAMTYLERRHPDRWKRRDELDFRKLTIDQLLALATAGEGGVESAGDRLATSSSEEG